MKSGIQTRLVLFTSVVLAVGLTLTGFVLDRSFHESIAAGAEEQLRLIVFSLMGVAQEHDDHLDFGDELPEPRLTQPESGLYATVWTQTGSTAWRSPSLIASDAALAAPQGMNPGEFRFEETGSGGTHFYQLNYAVIWEGVQDSVLIFGIATDRIQYQSAINEFRQTLYLYLGAVVAIACLALFLAVRWGLRPLRRMAGEVEEFEAGTREKLSDGYPFELRSLAANLDRFVAHEKRNRARYRTAMEDLAHSLKTPLAVIRNALTDPKATDSRLLREQLERMETTVAHQLSRANVTGPMIVTKPVDAAQTATRLLRALERAYAQRQTNVDIDVESPLMTRCDERDLMEILGNLLENAFKYGRSRVRVRGRRDGRDIRFVIDDDGPGIPDAMRAHVLNRGIRADERQSGQGIGLAMVADLLNLYGGEIAIGDSRLGGARLEVRIPV